MSKQRAEILKIVLDSNRHLSAEEIFMQCKKRGIDISIATVYRNLGILVHRGTLRKLSILGEPDRFDKTVTRHEHIFCDCCNEVQDIYVNDLKELLENKVGITLNSYDLCMRYTCPECRKQEETA
ncbi:MAG: Fur family transcriptional regulator [Eubacteriales bacterium]|nr:Fur family transcriptional regulator [Eubacteriales bacterium]